MNAAQGIGPNVIVIGAGVGGLALAQGLKRDGVPVHVYERDPSAKSPAAGYRLSISPSGARALKACLPPDAFYRLTQETGEPSRGVTFLDHRLNRLLAVDLPVHDRSSLDSERPVARTTLRRILLEGLDGAVSFGKTFVSFEDESDGRVSARFSDGSKADADLIVGADGANSKVRSELLPEARRVETGIVAIGGKRVLTESFRSLVPDVLMRGVALILGPRGCFMFMSPVSYADLRAAPDARDDPADREEHLMWGFSARRERFMTDDPLAAAPTDLKALVDRMTADWSPEIREVVRQSDPATVSSFSVKTSTPVKPWKTRNVTLLGDALHNMPPYRGVGANTAMWDAALLRDAIVGRGSEAPLIERLAQYERRMINHGFRAVTTSLAAMERFHSESVVERTVTKALLRVADHVPALQSALMGER